tara:strand:+ start:270 stop:923 length:654 start_codon:yes stop_codon:yes gene_type:complete
MGRCPPGVLCIENVTIVSLLLISIFVMLFIHYNYNHNHDKKKHNRSKNNVVIKPNNIVMRPNNVFTEVPGDVMMNIYEPPLRNDSIGHNSMFHNSMFHNSPHKQGGDIRGLPINIPTQSVDSSYRQVGILTRINGPEMILPLIGRPLFANKDKWNFYTMSNNNSMIKLPISHKGKSCTSEYGCENLYNGDSVYVEGYNDAFKATIYENQTMRYIPYL